MPIDWLTVVAQGANFIILVWLLRRFLYKPILHAIDARESRISAELADADTKRAAAEKERDDFQHKNEEFDRQRAGLLSQATNEAKAKRRQLLDEARQAADASSAKRQEALRSEYQNLREEINNRTREEVFAIARKALTDLASTSLEDRLVEVFTRRLRELDGSAKEGVAGLLESGSGPALVRSAFALSADRRAAIQKALGETFSAEIPLRFETSPDLIGGVELTANGRKVAWSIADYLASLEESVGELINMKSKPEPPPQNKTEPKPDAEVQ